MLRSKTGMMTGIKKSTRHFLSGILFCATILCSFNIAYAKGATPGIEKSGDLSNFAKNAPITTVRLDSDKFKTTVTQENPDIPQNPKLTYNMNNKYQYNKFEWAKISSDRYAIVVNDLTTVSTVFGNNGVMELGSFTLTYKDAAIMRDGTARDFSVTYTPQIVMKVNTESYTDNFRIAEISTDKPGITVDPLSANGKHFGLRVYVTCQVVGNDTDDLTGETFLLVSDEISTVRSGVNFESIAYAKSNNNYSEAIKFESGIDGESDIYLPGNTTLDIREDSNNTVVSPLTGVNGYEVRFVATGTQPVSLSHIAAAASASGVKARIWSSAGTNTTPLCIYYLDLSDFTKDYTSSSGENGKIELWTDGETHDIDSQANNFRKLDGGTSVTPYTYAVPNGKKVTYRMTPDKGYVIDKLYVNGSETNPTDITYKFNSNEIDYYEYSFDGSTVNSDQEISVRWKAVTYNITYNNVDDADNGKNPASYTIADTPITLNAPKKTGYTFDGWYKHYDFSGDKITQITKGNTGDVTLYAKWTRNGGDTPIVPIPPVAPTTDTTEKERPSKKFKDVDPKAWYVDYIDYAIENGLMNGVSADKFAPNATTTRAMIVTMLYRLAGEPAVSGTNPFKDVESGKWYTNAIIWAAENGIVTGYGDGKFGINDDITREQFAAILYRYAKYKGYDVSKSADLSKYTDASTISSYALDAMKWAVDEGIITGRTATTLAPKGNATRAEAAAMFMRFIESVK